MSINVTVNGNPCSVYKGKMVTTDLYQSKSDFDKRRLLRLQQVRQQSKDIAQDVRCKVQKEKRKQMECIEKQGKEKLKTWQNRKLLELQTQYKEAIKDLGVGHKEAENLSQKENIEKNQQDQVEEKKRGREAMKEMKIINDRPKIEKPTKITKSFRSPKKHIVKRPKKKSSASIIIAVSDNSTSESNENIDLLDITSQPIQTSEETSCECKDTPQSKSSDFDTGQPSPTNDVFTSTDKIPDHKPHSEKNKVNKSKMQPDTGYDKIGKIQPETRNETVASKQPETPYDSRISERIKRRQVMSPHPEYDQELAELDTLEMPKSNTKIRNIVHSRNQDPISEKTCDCDKLGFGNCNCCCRLIPEKPKIKLKGADESTNKSTVTSLTSNKISYYDHKSKYEGTTKQPLSSFVEKLNLDNIEIDEQISDRDYMNKMRQRDKEAVARANRALEKEKIHRDYNEIIKKLPMLQKQERLARLHTDKPEYHMSEKRLQDLEQKKQNQLENAFSKRFPQIITLPSKSDKADMFVIDDKRNCETTESESWNPDKKKLFTTEEVHNIIKAFSEPTYEDRKNKFKELLKNLKFQKKRLIEEIKLLPRDKSVMGMLKDLGDIDSDNDKKKDNKIKFSDLSPVSEESDITEKRTIPMRKRKMKGKTKVLIKQNMSTQTTPESKNQIIQVGSISKDSQVKSTPVEKKPITSSTAKLCELTHIPCDCSEIKEVDDDKLEIFIQFNEAEKPQVIVKDKNSKAEIIEQPVKQPEKQVTTSSESWKEQFSKNSTTSTSYFSPPNIDRMTICNDASLYNLRKKPQQCNISDCSSRKTEPEILSHIQKLLNMSRTHIDTLPISSSSVTTPNQSIVEIDSNIPEDTSKDVYNLVTKYLPNVKRNLNCSPYKERPSYCDVSICPYRNKEPKNKTTDAENCAQQYANITESTSKKIQILAGMIEKLRQEKNKIMDGSVGDKEVSTPYAKESDPSPSNSPSLNDEELNKKLLDVDLNLADQLRRNKSKPQTESHVTISSEPPPEMVFVPFISDIPKLPKFQMAEENGEEERTKPPPSKGLTSAKKFNGNISIKPHELSVIVEAESQISTKMDNSNENESIESLQCGNINYSEEASQGKVSPVMSSSSEESLESILKSIGMEWAIPTLQKTKEALALTTSTGSESSLKLKGGSIQGRSNRLRKNDLGLFIQQISSSTLLASLNSSSIISEFSDVSAIQSKEKSRHRTSTPVLKTLSKSAESFKQAFSGETDLSTVKNMSEEQNLSDKKDSKKNKSI